MSSDVQLDLFGAVESAENRVAALLEARGVYRSRFVRVEFASAYDCGDMTKEGDRVLGWQCPACGGISWNGCLLAMNHGYDPGQPDQWSGRWTGDPWGTWCYRQNWRQQRGDAGLSTGPDPAGFDDIGVIRLPQTPLR